MASNPRYDDPYFMHLAYLQARESFEEGGIPVGAVLATPGEAQPLAVGHNRRNQESNRILHGEMSCLRSLALAPLPATASLYTTLNPCAMCAGAIRQFGIRRVVIGQARIDTPAQAAFVGNADALAAAGVEIVMLESPACAELFDEFLSSPDGLRDWLGDIGK